MSRIKYVPATKTKHAPDMKHAFINKMCLLSRVYSSIIKPPSFYSIKDF